MRRIFIDNQDAGLFSGDDSAHLYEQRCLGLAGPTDTVVLSSTVDPAIIGYYARLEGGPRHILTTRTRELDLAASILADKAIVAYLRKASQEDACTIEPFLWGQSFGRLVQELQIPVNADVHIYDRYGTKSGFRELAGVLGLPIPDGVVVRSSADWGAVIDIGKRYPTLVGKTDLSIGSSGIAILSALDREQLYLSREACGYPHVYEEYIAPLHHGSLHLVFSPDRTYTIHCAETFCQHLDYMGFTYPAFGERADELQSYACRIATYLLKTHEPKGCIGFDFVIDGTGALRFLECNPRRTAVTYVLGQVERCVGSLNGMCDIAARRISVCNTQTSTVDNATHALAPILYGYGRSNDGILLHNMGLYKKGVLEVIAISQVGATQELLKEAERILRCELS
jgi:hypothetical protein